MANEQKHEQKALLNDPYHIDSEHIDKASSEYLKYLSTDAENSIRSYNAQEEHRDHVNALTALLFPHAKVGTNPFERKGAIISNKEMSIIDTPYQSGEARNLQQLYPCVICRDMSYCPRLNGFQIQEVYLPYNLNDLGTCKVLDALGEKVATEVFGNGRTFRDTPQCKDIVMQYLCLFYGSDNDMYTNNCINQEDVSDSNPINHKVAPRPPCRSFCVQVAEVCASDPKFMQLCYNIKCPPMQDSCEPDPKVAGQVLAANIGCDTPYNANPYFKKNSASSNYASPRHLILLSVSVVMFAALYDIL